MSLGLCLGDPVNILDGMAPPWPDGVAVSYLVLPTARPLVGFPVETPASHGAWQPISASLHDHVGSLAGALFGHRLILPHDDLGQRPVSTGTLLLGDGTRTERTAAFGRAIGIDLQRPGIGGFILLRMERRDETVSHPVLTRGIGERSSIEGYWTREGRHAMARLRTGATRDDPDGVRRAAIPPRHAQRYLDYARDWGTHFVARVEIGQVLFQVLACRADRHQVLSEVWRRETGGREASGPLALTFAGLAGSEWLIARGPVRSAVAEPALEAARMDGFWRGDDTDGQELLLAPFQRTPSRASALLDACTGCAPLRMDLSAQARLMGEARSQAWQKLLNVALVQRYGPADPWLDCDVPEVERQTSPWTSRIDPGGPWLRSGVPPMDLVGIGLCAVIDTASPIELPGVGITALAGTIHARRSGRTDGCGIATLRTTDQELDRLALHAGRIWGVVTASNRSGSRRHTCGFDLRLGFDRDGQLAVGGDPAKPPLFLLRDTLGVLASTIDMAHLALSAKPDAGGRSAAAVARQHLDWLADLVAVNRLDATGQPDSQIWRSVRIHALRLARLGPATTACQPAVFEDVVFLKGRLCDIAMQMAGRRDTVEEADLAELRQIALEVDRLQNAARDRDAIATVQGAIREAASQALGRLKDAALAMERAGSRLPTHPDKGSENLGGEGMPFSSRVIGVATDALKRLPATLGGQGDTAASLEFDQVGIEEPLAELQRAISATLSLLRWLSRREDERSEEAIPMLAALPSPLCWPGTDIWRMIVEDLPVFSHPEPSGVAATVETLGLAGAEALNALSRQVSHRLFTAFPAPPVSALLPTLEPSAWIPVLSRRLDVLIASRQSIAKFRQLR